MPRAVTLRFNWLPIRPRGAKTAPSPVVLTHGWVPVLGGPTQFLSVFMADLSGKLDRRSSETPVHQADRLTAVVALPASRAQDLKTYGKCDSQRLTASGVGWPGRPTGGASRHYCSSGFGRTGGILSLYGEER